MQKEDITDLVSLKKSICKCLEGHTQKNVGTVLAFLLSEIIKFQKSPHSSCEEIVNILREQAKTEL